MTLRKHLLAMGAMLIVILAMACGDDEAAPNGGMRPAGISGISPVFSCEEPPAATQPDESAFPVTVEGRARAVTLAAPPRAIASLSAGHTEILYAIGAGGQVVAVDNTSDCPGAVADLPHVDAFSPSVESILALEPDLVLLFFDPGGLADSIEQQGVPVLLLDSPSSAAGVYDQIELLGQITGHADEARQLVGAMAAAVRSIQDRLEDVAQGPQVFHEIDNTYFTAGPGSFVHDLYAMLRARNIAEPTGEPFLRLSAEAILAADPDVIILADEEAGESPQTVAARPGWSGISAVKSERVYVIDPDIVSRPGPRLVDALLRLAPLLYPEVFD